MKYPIEPGVYEIKWENTNSSEEIVSQISITHEIHNEDKLRELLDHELIAFDKLKKDSKLVLIGKAPERHIAILNYDDETQINILIDGGYVIKEFFGTKCILSKREQTFL